MQFRKWLQLQEVGFDTSMIASVPRLWMPRLQRREWPKTLGNDLVKKKKKKKKKHI